MIRTIHEHHQSYRRLMELAKRAPIERRENLLKVARLGLKFAQLQLRDPSQRPDTRLRMSADQYRAIAECLSAKPELAKRACYFEAMAESATLNDWPSSATAPYLVLTRFFWVAALDQLHGALDVGEEHRHLLALAFQRPAAT
jgi:hypothetical protein